MRWKRLVNILRFALMFALMTLVLASSAEAAKFKVLYSFDGDQQWSPGELVLDSEGNLYGTTRGGQYDSHKYGTVFRLSPNPDGSWTQSVLHTFNFSDGSDPCGKLIFDAAGNLYGATLQGGPQGWGTVFKLTPQPDGNWTESVVYGFGLEGRFPCGGVIFDEAGNLYGTTGAGGDSYEGSVYQLTPNPDGSWTESILYSFEGLNAIGPNGGLIFDRAGNLYGTTHYIGTAFKLSPKPDGSWTKSVLYRFHKSHGEYPNGNLIPDAAGNIYGTTEGGGKHGWGVVFRLEPTPVGHWTERVLHNFGGDAKGPAAGLTFDTAGNLYGTTQFGGTDGCHDDLGCGTAFKLVPQPDGSWKFGLVHLFHGKGGAEPITGVILDQAGNLYGTTSKGGQEKWGIVYRIGPF
jgi:uncharacterized repeat protein (TIGR03803 family)